MREILFRGKRVDNGTWAYGDLLHCDDEMEIDSESLGENGGYIIPETVGQYTGLCDRNRKKIFEGDIVETKYGRLCEVVWYSSNRYQSWGLKPLETKHRYPDAYDVWASNNLEVIGNVFDNPDFLEVKQ